MAFAQMDVDCFFMVCLWYRIMAIRMKSISTLCWMLSFVIPPLVQRSLSVSSINALCLLRCMIYINTCILGEHDPLPQCVYTLCVHGVALSVWMMLLFCCILSNA